MTTLERCSVEQFKPCAGMTVNRDKYTLHIAGTEVVVSTANGMHNASLMQPCRYYAQANIVETRDCSAQDFEVAAT